MATSRHEPTSDTDITPDHVEQRQRADGTVVDPETVPEVPDAPLSPDELEQRQEIVDPDDFDDDEPVD